MDWKRVKKAAIAIPLSVSLLVTGGITAVGTVSAAAADSQPTVSTPGADLRATLSQLLATHFIYQTETTLKAYQKAKEGGPTGEGLDEAKAHLIANADKLTGAVKSVYGQKAADAFDKIFDSQYDDSSGYGKAVAMGNQEKIDEIKKSLLQTFPTELGTLLSGATGGELPKDMAITVLRKHEKDVMQFLSNYKEGNFKEAYTQFNEGYKRMFTLGTALSSAIVKQSPDKFDNTWAVTPASDLRATFSRLLGAHFFYQTATTVEGYKAAKGDWGKDFEVVKEMQEANAANMTAAVKGLYGQKAADAFAKIFSSQYTDSAGYGKAVATGNMEKAKEIQDHLLNTFAVDLGTLLSGATEGNLPKDTAISVLQKHEQSTLDVLSSYVDGNFKAQYDTYTEGHALMFTIGTALSGGIVKQMPEKFAVEMPGMPKTDMGATADNGSETLALGLTAMAALILGGVFIYRRKSTDVE